jgi:hypothetical protein
MVGNLRCFVYLEAGKRQQMRKKTKKCLGDRHLSKAGICFEALEPRLLLSGSWGAVVDSSGPETQTDVHGGLTKGSVAFHVEAGFSGSANAQVNLTPGSGHVDLLSRTPALNTLGNPLTALDPSSASIPVAPVAGTTLSSPLADQSGSPSTAEMIAGTVESVARREVVFVNDNVAAYEILINGIRDSDTNQEIEIVVLDADRDGIGQVSDILAERSELSAIHVIAHGTDGQINLGNSWLNSATLQQNRDVVAGWGSALSETGDILFYGCNLTATQAGQALTDTLAQLTGADVAASDDISGHEKLGGNWELEYDTGGIETQLAFTANIQNNWFGVLGGAPLLDLDADDSSGQSGADYAVTFTENGGAVGIVDADVALSDADTETVLATVTFTNETASG